MKAFIGTITKKYERTGDSAKIAGTLVFSLVLTVVWLGILFNSGI